MRIYALLLLVSALRGMGAAPPNIVFISGEFEYHSKETFPVFARQLSTEYNVHTLVLQRPDDEKTMTIAGLERLEDADLLIIMIRRMVLPPDQLDRFKKYLARGKPLIGLRTASHSFENWKEFDSQVLGGNYQNHYPNAFKTSVTLIPEETSSPLLRGVTAFVSEGSLYKNRPLVVDSVPILRGSIEGQAPEPIAWTHEYHHGRIFYSSLGHPNDFQIASFQHLLRNAIEWTLNEPLEARKTP